MCYFSTQNFVHYLKGLNQDSSKDIATSYKIDTVKGVYFIFIITYIMAKNKTNKATKVAKKDAKTTAPNTLKMINA